MQQIQEGVEKRNPRCCLKWVRRCASLKARSMIPRQCGEVNYDKSKLRVSVLIFVVRHPWNWISGKSRKRRFLRVLPIP